jgi:carbon-monoxide dehydrogenase large subunit
MPMEGAILAFDEGKLVVRLGMQPSGQGHATVFGNLVAERLGIARDRVVIEQGDSDLPLRGGPAVGSRSATTAGTAIVEGIERLVATARAAAAGLLQADVANIAYRDGYLEVTGTNYRISLFDLAERMERSGSTETLTTVAQVDTVTTFPNGCHIAEVEIDPDTGKVAVIGYVAVDDCGVVLDHTLAEAQIVGGLAQGLGQALLERVVYDESGQQVTASLMDYAMPRAEDMPPIVSVFQPVPCRTNPLGVKGVGEAGTTGAIAAIMNAISDAIPGGHGAAIDMPATPEKVWRACAQSLRPDMEQKR